MNSTAKTFVRLFILAALIAMGFSVRAAHAQSERQRPNILFIYADDQSYKSISCYGAGPEWAKTPNIDAIARRGVRFHRAYLGAWCMPSRASVLTGRLQHGVESMRMEEPYPSSTYDPAEAVDDRKQAKLSQLALQYLKRHGLLEYRARFDVVGITWPTGARRPQIRHYQNAFEAVGQGQMFS